MNEENDDKKETSDNSEDSNESSEGSLDFDDDKIEEIVGDIYSSEEELAILEDKYLRLQAEFDNYRKRMSARYDEAARFASESIILKALEVVDNLERAIEVDFGADPESAKSGIQAIHKQLEKILTNEHVRPINSVGKEFDPYYQNAIQTVTDESLPDRIVVHEFQKGYMIREKVLRPAMVSVNRHIEPVPADNGTDNVTDSDEHIEELRNDNEPAEKNGDDKCQE